MLDNFCFKKSSLIITYSKPCEDRVKFIFGLDDGVGNKPTLPTLLSFSTTESDISTLTK